MSETIRDDRGRIIAHMKDEGDTIRLYNPVYRTLGFYKKTRNQTVDSTFKVIGNGNQLLRLLDR